MSKLGYIQMSLKDPLLSVSLLCHLASIILCALILSETLALYKSFTYLLTYLLTYFPPSASERRRGLVAGSSNFLTHSCKFLTEVIADAQNLNFASKFPQIWISASYFVFLEQNYLRKIFL